MWYSYDGGSKWWKGEQPARLAVLSRQRRRQRSVSRSTAACRTTARGSASRNIPAASPTRSGKTCTAATASGCSPIRPIPITFTPNTRAATSARVNRHTHEARDIQPKPNYKEKLRCNWNTPIALSPNEKGTIYIGAQFLFRSRESRADLGAHLSRPDARTIPRSRSRNNRAASPSTTRRRKCTPRSTRSANRRKIRRSSGSAPTTATCRSRATARRPGPTSSATSRACRRIPGSAGCRPATSMRAPLTPRSIATPSATRALRVPHRRFRQDLDSARHPAGCQRRARICARHQGRSGSAEPVVPRDRVRSVYFHRWRQSLGAIQRQPFSGRRRARPRDPSARQRSRSRDARSRHLDRRRHHAVARADCGPAETGGELCFRAAGAAAHRGERRLGEWRRGLCRR